MSKMKLTTIILALLASAGAVNAENYPVGDSIEGRNPIVRGPVQFYETFPSGGWNASTIFPDAHNPGLNESLPKNFFFVQFQGPHSFKEETVKTRLGAYSAKLHWRKDNPGQWNGDPKKLDNTDRKAMMHGKRADSIKTDIWYGFSVYFDKALTKLTSDQQMQFFQVHSAPDKGELSPYPPVALQMTLNGLEVHYTWDSAKTSTSFGGEGSKQFVVPLKFSDYQNRWVDVVVQVRTNPFEPKGFIKVWLDGVQMVNKQKIQLGFNDDKGTYPSYGLYLWGDNYIRDSGLTMYIDEIRQAQGTSATYYDVAPGYFEKK